MKIITCQEFEQVELRSGTIIRAEEFARAKKPLQSLLVGFADAKGAICLITVDPKAPNRQKLC